jgi:hypothetical protein
MRGVGRQTLLPTDDLKSLVDIELPRRVLAWPTMSKPNPARFVGAGHLLTCAAPRCASRWSLNPAPAVASNLDHSPRPCMAANLAPLRGGERFPNLA